MKLFVMLILGIIITSVGIQGNLGSLLAVFMSAQYLETTQ